MGVRRMKGVNFILGTKHIAILDRLYAKKGFKNRSQLVRDLIELEDRIDKREQIMQENIQHTQKNSINTVNLTETGFNATKTLPDKTKLNNFKTNNLEGQTNDL